MTHALKVWPEFYKEIESGQKEFEVRKYDRPFKKGEILLLQEWDPNTKQYTGKECNRVITYIILGGVFGIEKDYCVMGLKEHSLYN